ncbi:Vegetative incompatibility protein HET-E-1 [Fusarium oxysporum f. sp. cubense]|uniref:Mitochondrial division protein 1 n=1 Tax=Fusarium oxysporum f. sp. cubense TaxID=61366 RepID=A0A559KVJ9_FUSOC|nr:Vegetative incompatibility protein HET-E-1 [Fusarium oxysporum f. sp. cubense]
MAEALGVASSVIAVVDLSAKVINWCIRYAQDVSHAKDDKKRLAEEVTRLNLASVNARNLLDGPHGSRLKASHALYLATVNSQSQLRRVESRLIGGSGRANINIEALKWPFKSKDIQSVIQDVHRCIKAIYSALEVDQTSILLDIDHKIALDTLPVAEGASFDSHAEEHNPTCLPNTRQEMLDNIDHWIDDPNSKTVYWLNGMAGTGKSTIARTVAYSRSKRGDLGASFFFKRGETDRGNLTKFVPTMARRLAWSIPEVAKFMKNAVDVDPAIADKAVREQFEKLVREPLSKATATSLSRPSVVIIVDALDKCEKDADIKLLLELFSSLRFPGSLLVRVFVTSRPELPVRLGFSSIGNNYQDLILHKIPQSIIEHDISVFLRHEFANIRCRFNEQTVEELKLPVYWPGEANLEKLTRAAVPLFIFAATLCRFVNDSCLGSPDKLLQSVLHHTSNGYASKLDMTYSPVLEQQVVNRSGRERCDIVESFRLVIGTIITLASPLSYGWVRSVVFSKDSTLIASGSHDKTVKIWNVATGEEEQTLEGHTDTVRSVIFSKDGKLIASGSYDKTVKIWTVATGIKIRSFDASRLTKVFSFADDDSVLVTSAGRFGLGFRDASTSHSSESELKLGGIEVQGEVDARLGFGINHDNTWITAGGADGREVLWLPPDFRPGVSTTLTEPLRSVVIGCSSGRVVVIGFEESSLSDAG